MPCPHRYPQWDLDEYAVGLKEGWNLLLVKLAHDTISDDRRFYHSRKEVRSAFLARMVMPRQPTGDRTELREAQLRA